MQIQKLALKIFATSLTLFAMSIPAFASTPQIDFAENVKLGIVAPQWTNITQFSAYLSSSGLTLYPMVLVEASSDSAGITGTMSLQEYSSGSWSNVESWPIGDRGSATVSGVYEGESGYKYRTKVVVTVNGEKATTYSKTCSI